jgi:hypothetical protein
MKLLKVRLFSCMVAAVLLPLLLAPAVAEAAAWTLVPSPSPGSVNDLNGVASVSATDVWAVGDTNQQTLTEHWNGTAWSVVASPNASSNDALLGVAAVSTTDVWAVGQFISGSNVETLIEQWNGTAWSVVTSLNPSASDNNLNAAAADPASGQAWAVGAFFSSTSSGLQTLTEFNP